MAQIALRKTTEQAEESHPYAPEVLKKNTYMDDICDSVPLILKYRTWIELLYLAKMKPTLRIDRHFEVTTNGRQQMERIRRI